MRGTTMRRLVLGLVTVFALLSTACDDEATASPKPESEWPASAAGVVCQLLEYDAVTKVLGTTFDNAGGAKQDTTLTCALTQKDHDLPYLTLALAPSTIDSVVFSESVKPQGAYSMPDIGVIAYRLTVAPPTPDVGPVLEFVWLSNTSRLCTLRYGFETATPPEQVEAMIPKMQTLAQNVEDALPK